jgi:DNA gyrase subunit A
VPGNTLDHVVFFADDGTAYTMQMHDVPAHTGYGEPITKFFRLADKVRIIGAVSTDERFVPVESPPANGVPAGPYVLVVTAGGFTLRVPFAAYRTTSTKVGRRYVRLSEGDRVVLATLIQDEPSLILASAKGHVIHFPIEEINVLSGAGKGVIGIKLAKGDRCIGGAVVSDRNNRLVVETTADKTLELTARKYTTVSRGGKGFAAVKRSSFERVIPPAIELVDWEALEPKTEEKPRRGESGGRNGNGQKSLFD